MGPGAAARLGWEGLVETADAAREDDSGAGETDAGDVETERDAEPASPDAIDGPAECGVAPAGEIAAEPESRLADEG